MPVSVPEEIAENDLGTLVEASKCFACMSQSQKLHAKLWFMAKAVGAITGGEEDFSNVNQLMEVSACFKCAPDSTLEAMEVAIFYQLAVALGALEGISEADAKEAMKCYSCMDSKAARAAFVLLLHELTVEIEPPA